ncbi:hypothetical protein EVAR_23423_1 [Eumeta japonica]|uniref:Uncharacterized protein n=1 Tax=Eumeta variegata TaxID=151549 RepID=A0A4C1UJL5_EUMVA|nr:hypothetical protein EVAR_23423_1 [Eumeta japonica]
METNMVKVHFPRRFQQQRKPPGYVVPNGPKPAPGLSGKSPQRSKARSGPRTAARTKAAFFKLLHYQTLEFTDSESTSQDNTNKETRLGYVIPLWSSRAYLLAPSSE